MKSYTDIEQSKKLAEILPLETADMYWIHVEREGFNDWWKVETIQGSFRPFSMNIPCWSLQALLDEIPYTIMNKQEEDLELHIEKDGLQYYLFYENEYNGDMFEIETDMYDNMIDACVEMILKLHELKLL